MHVENGIERMLISCSRYRVIVCRRRYAPLLRGKNAEIWNQNKWICNVIYNSLVMIVMNISFGRKIKQIFLEAKRRMLLHEISWREEMLNARKRAVMSLRLRWYSLFAYRPYKEISHPSVTIQSPALFNHQNENVVAWHGDAYMSSASSHKMKAMKIK